MASGDAVRMTELEREVASRVLRGEDPWGPKGYTGGSRLVSQALGRLKRKGLMMEVGDTRALTALGRALVSPPEHVGTTKAGTVMQVCSRCDGTGVDPDSPDCTCDVCGGTFEEEVPA